ncbi:hypothetical protein PTTG_12310 [Puccinia triticina 1-1 BBBD Race 1]|uniref:Uncharacterized protein n=1 Tax=Puccinia triticina (isolate 1-1 / race 1 (BBBD)) TaxID=630390 RepID=A0A180GKI6_PUCT1|nr:hypothetical protein PTTG_12310 [Puccinia triticina 1-1 BBBD Race 1]
MTKHIGQPVPPPRGLASLADFLGYSKPWSPGSLFRNSASSASTNQIVSYMVVYRRGHCIPQILMRSAIGLLYDTRRHPTSIISTIHDVRVDVSGSKAWPSGCNVICAYRRRTTRSFHARPRLTQGARKQYLAPVHGHSCKNQSPNTAIPSLPARSGKHLSYCAELLRTLRDGVPPFNHGGTRIGTRRCIRFMFLICPGPGSSETTSFSRFFLVRGRSADQVLRHKLRTHDFLLPVCIENRNSLNLVTTSVPDVSLEPRAELRPQSSPQSQSYPRPEASILISCSHGRCLRRGLWKRMNDMDQLKVPLLSKDYSSEFARASDAGAYNERTVHRGKGRQHYINEDSDSLDGPPKNSETTKAVPKDQMAGSRPDRDFKNESGGPSGSKIPIVKENKEQEIRVSLPPDSLVRAEGKLTKIKMKVFRIISPRATMKPSWCLNWLFEARKSDKGEDPEFIEPYEFLKSIFEGGLLHDRFF